VFIENYNVTIAELLTTAADVSEQISTAGKEASGTGNMKFMLNGALTIGTFDGANVEMSEQAGIENMFIFGLRADEVAKRYRFDTAEVQSIYASNMPLKRVLDQLIDGTIEPNHPQLFKEIYQSLLFGDYGTPDPYMVVRDFDAYRDMQATLAREFTNKALWNKKAVIYTAAAGFFSSDRTIAEYNKYIWNLPSIK
ncbi:MAG: glycogen/starch/alpha-glucan phosphorylase, partial [Clostridia bacterium]|nr:glycogen/starch/alpha-glucan phosphorylase [Clostridia bacterium]